jgi:hypothetical protein
MKTTPALLTITTTALLFGTAQAVTFDFRANFAGGNVGDIFNEQTSASATVGGVTINGEVTIPCCGEFNLNIGSADLGIGVNDVSGPDRPTQIEVGEEVSFTFDPAVQLHSITLQVFFLSSSDGAGGPVANHEDGIRITLGGITRNILSPVVLAPGDSTFYTIDLTSEFPSTILNSGEELILAPSQGDGLRLTAIDLAIAPVPDAASSLSLLSLALAGFCGFRFASRKQ